MMESHMKLEGPSMRLTIFIGESDQWHHHPVYTEIVHRAHRAGLAGVSLSEDLPVAIVIVDTAERIEAFIPELDELIQEGLVILDPVKVIKYVGRASKGTSD
jgi:uncharacterized protein